MSFENCIDFNQTNATHETSKLADSDPDDIRNAEKAGWISAAGELAEWSLGLLNRSDAWIRWDSDALDLRTGKPIPGYRKATGTLNAYKLERHFSGTDTLAIYSTDPVDNSCRWLWLDIDQHEDDEEAAELNLSHSLTILERCHLAGLAAILEDSNGNGGFHIGIRFTSPIPASLARSLGRWLTRDLPECEIFPKQDELKTGSYGNAIRLPGKHATRNHWSRFWHEGRWLSGSDAVAHLLSFEADGNQPRDIAEFIAWHDTAKAQKDATDKARQRMREWRGDADWDDVVAALQYIDPDGPYHLWRDIGFALHAHSPTFEGFKLWEDWSSTGHKHEDRLLRKRPSYMWEKFNGCGGIGIGTLFYHAQQNGYQPPAAFSQSCDQPIEPDVLLVNSRPIEHEEQPRDLTEYRDEMEYHRLRSLREPGTVNLDRGPTGSGKNHAEVSTLKHYLNQEWVNETDAKAVILTHTHDAAAEVLDDLRAAGIPAESFPKLDEDTCQNWEKAEPVQRAGLPVSLTICQRCKFKDSCQYKQQVSAAESSDVQIMTQHRAAHRGLNWEKTDDDPFSYDVGYLSIHEDPVNLIRPTLTASSSSRFERMLSGLKKIRLRNERTKSRGDSLLKQHRLLTRMIEIGTDILADLQFPEDLPTAVNLHHEPLEKSDIPDGIFRKLNYYLDLDRDTHGLPLLLAAAAGKLESLTVYDGKAIGTGRNELPENAVVWINDATADRKRLENLTGLSIIDRTPTGRLAWHHEPVQIPREILKTTAGKTVRGIVAGFLAQNPTVLRLGILTHRNLISEIEDLPPVFRDRIEMIDYHRSGTDVGSNEWFSRCDHLLFLGSSRVPPDVIRDALVHEGNLKAAQRDGDWGRTAWEAPNTDGKLERVYRNHYRDPDWRRVAGYIVRDRVIQAVGRGRGLLEDGIPVTIVTNEDTGYRIDAKPFQTLSEAACQILQELNDTDTGMKTAELAERCQISESLTRRHLRTLSDSGLIEKIGNARATVYQMNGNEDLPEVSGTKPIDIPKGKVPDTHTASSSPACLNYGISPDDVFILAEPVFWDAEPPEDPPPDSDFLELNAHEGGMLPCK